MRTGRERAELRAGAGRAWHLAGIPANRRKALLRRGFLEGKVASVIVVHRKSPLSGSIIGRRRTIHAIFGLNLQGEEFPVIYKEVR